MKQANIANCAVQLVYQRIFLAAMSKVECEAAPVEEYDENEDLKPIIEKGRVSFGKHLCRCKAL